MPYSHESNTIFVNGSNEDFCLSSGQSLLTAFSNFAERAHSELSDPDYNMLKAEQADGLKDIIRDYKIILNWLGVKSGTINDDQRKYWGRTWVSYCAEGKAPSIELGDTFKQYQEWAKEENWEVIPLTDEIRRVMDRMLATDKKIAEKAGNYNLTPNKDAVDRIFLKILSSFKEMATKPAASKGVQKDWDQIKQWIGSVTGEFNEIEKQKWFDTCRSYFSLGNASSSKLNTLFQESRKRGTKEYWPTISLSPEIIQTLNRVFIPSEAVTMIKGLRPELKQALDQMFAPNVTITSDATSAAKNLREHTTQNLQVALSRLDTKEKRLAFIRFIGGICLFVFGLFKAEWNNDLGWGIFFGEGGLIVMLSIWGGIILAIANALRLWTGFYEWLNGKQSQN